MSDDYPVVEVGELVSEKTLPTLCLTHVHTATINIVQTMNVAKYSGYI